METRLRRFNGEYRSFLFRTCPLADAYGQVVKWCGVSIDITDQRRSEQTLHARWWLLPFGRRQHFRSITAELRGAIVLMTAAGELEHANRHVPEYFGATHEEIRGWTTADIVPPDELSRLGATRIPGHSHSCCDAAHVMRNP